MTHDDDAARLRAQAQADGQEAMSQQEAWDALSWDLNVNAARVSHQAVAAKAKRDEAVAFLLSALAFAVVVLILAGVGYLAVQAIR